MTPAEIRLDASRTQLSVTWDNGMISTYAAALLRERARDAGSVRAAMNDWAVPAAPDLKITAVDPIGNYAVRLAFSDGHDRGIFPWAYLAEIAELLLEPTSAADLKFLQQLPQTRLGTSNRKAALES